MHIGPKRQKKEKKAMSVSLYGNLFFVIIELVMAIYTSSQAVLLDGVYDAVEFFMLLPSIFLIPLLYKPSNEKHPFGYLQLESMFVVVKGATMTAVTFGLIASNIDIMLHGGREISFGTVAYFELFAAILGILVSLYLKNKNGNVKSQLIEMEMHGWKIDSIISLCMTLAFFLPEIITASWFTPLVPYLDQIIAIVLSLVMIPTPIRAVVTGLRDLSLLPPEDETIEEIKEVVEDAISECSYKNLYYDIVRTGRKLWISVYVTFEQDMLSISRMKKLQDECIIALSHHYSDFYFELLPDVEFVKADIKEEIV